MSDCGGGWGRGCCWLWEGRISGGGKMVVGEFVGEFV